MIRPRLRRLAPALILPAVLLAGCSATASASAPSSSPSPAAPTVLDNCGFPVPVDEPPTRILTIKSAATEMLLALGLGDRIVGQAFSDGPVPAQWAAQAAAIPQVSANLPSAEATLALEPDMIFAGWESNVTDQGVGDRAALGALGVRTYVAPSACKGAGYKPAKLTFDLLFEEIEEAGLLFGASEKADALVSKQRDALSSISPVPGHPTALWYSSGGDVPYVGAGIGAPQMIMEAAGLRNIAESLTDTWASYNWEAIVAANPDVIVLIDASWNSAKSKMDRLASNPATAQMDAVKNRRYVVVPFAGGEAGVRNVDVVADIVTQVKALGLGTGK